MKKLDLKHEWQSIDTQGYEIGCMVCEKHLSFYDTKGWDKHVDEICNKALLNHIKRIKSNATVFLSKPCSIIKQLIKFIKNQKENQHNENQC